MKKSSDTLGFGSKRQRALVAFVVLVTILSTPSAAFATTIFLTSGTSWSVPSDWSNSANTIEVIGGGGGGASAAGAPAGGGGGAYSKITNLSLTPGGSANIQVGSGGSMGNAGGDTWFNGSGGTCAAQSVCAKGGSTGSGTTGGTGGASGSGTGSTKYSGGKGGDSTHSLVSGTGGGSAGGEAGGGDTPLTP